MMRPRPGTSNAQGRRKRGTDKELGIGAAGGLVTSHSNGGAARK